MSKSEQELLKRLCSKPETLFKTKELLSIAKAKTGPGSGHSLGANALGLPAICAYLASQQVGNDDVTERVAQQASCLVMKSFRSATNAVRLALASHLEDDQEESDGTMFQELAGKYKIDNSAVEWMKEVFTILRKCRELKVNDFDPYGAEVQCTIFCWVAVELHYRNIKSADLQTIYKIRRGDTLYLTEIIEKYCANVRVKMDKYVSQASPSRSSRTASKTPSPTKTKTRLGSLMQTSAQKRGGADSNSQQSPLKKRKIDETVNEKQDTPMTPSQIKISALPEASTPSKQKRQSIQLKSSIANNDEADMDKRLDDLSMDDANDLAANPKDTPRTPKTPRRQWQDANLYPTPVSTLESNVDVTPSRKDSHGGSRPQKDKLQVRPVTAFRDRLFWFYRDPNVVTEWNACEEYATRHRQIAVS